MLKLPLLRSDVVYVAPESAGGDLYGVWLGRRHLAAWWRGDGPWPVGFFRCLGSDEDWYIVTRVWPSSRTRLVGRQRQPSGLTLRGIRADRGRVVPFRRWATVKPWPAAATELCFDAGQSVAVLEATSFYEAARQAILANGGRQARGVFVTLEPGTEGPVARFTTRDGRSVVRQLAGELDVSEPVAVPAALPRWLWWAGCRDDLYSITRPPFGGWAAWWGDPRLGLAMRAWVDDRGTVVQRRPRRG